MNAAVSLTSREEIEVHHFGWGASFGVPAVAILMQVYLTQKIHFLQIFDLPLLVTIFFAVARRRPIPGMFTGAFIGLAQDAFTQLPIGLYGIANTLIGYAGSSLGVKLDVDNPGSRFLMTFGFFLVHRFIYVVIDLGLVGGSQSWEWSHTVIAAMANGFLAVLLFAALDHFKERA